LAQDAVVPLPAGAHLASFLHGEAVQRFFDDPTAFGPHDVVICALKAQQAHACAAAFAPL